VRDLTTHNAKMLVRSEIIAIFSLLLLVISAIFAWVSYGNYTSGIYFSVSEFWNFYDLIIDMFFAGVFSTLFVVFLSLWASTKMKYLETERQQLREEIKKELEMERQKKEADT
jgi:uncharacterized membrane protein